MEDTFSSGGGSANGAAVGAMTEAGAAKLREEMAKLSELEKEIWRKDKYVDDMVKKYRAFQFNLKLFFEDAELAGATFSENIIVPDGRFAGRAFWGHHMSGSRPFRPHGLCVMIDRKRRILHMGGFKDGSELGLQRIVKSVPRAQLTARGA